MLFDFNEAWPRVAPIAQYDVGACGTGPAGITIARKLAAHGKKILLSLEAGDLSGSNLKIIDRFGNRTRSQTAA